MKNAPANFDLFDIFNYRNNYKTKFCSFAIIYLLSLLIKSNIILNMLLSPAATQLCWASVCAYCKVHSFAVFLSICQTTPPISVCQAPARPCSWWPLWINAHEVCGTGRWLNSSPIPIGSLSTGLWTLWARLRWR